MSVESSIDPRIQEALSHHQGGRFQEARAIYEALLAENPEHAEAAHLLGIALHQQNQNREALPFLDRALELNPQNPGYHYNRGVVLQQLLLLPEAEATYRRVIALDPSHQSAWVNLGNLLSDVGRFGESCDCHRNALNLQPGDPDHHLRLARSLRMLGDIENALSHLGCAIELRPGDSKIHSALLFTSQYEPGISLPELERRHRIWASTLPPPVPAEGGEFSLSLSSPPFRIGFLSPDLGNHPVGIFVAPLLERLKDSPEVITICLNDRREEDEYITRNRAAANEWIEAGGLSDAALYQVLVDSKLDLLIELAGHTDNNRLPVLARRPASIQATWAGYVGTTGLDAIDYLIADAYHCPDGSEDHYSETLLRFPNGYIPWEPPSYAPDPGPLPVLHSGRPTFGCLNNPSKLTPPTLRIWSQVLQAVPEARLLLKYKGMDDPAVQRRIKGLLSAYGVHPDRVEMRGQSQHRDHLAVFQEIDVALDPTPYSGGVSTCEALWMGVPVVTCPGSTFASRHSLSHIINAGFPDLITSTPREYVAKAAQLVADPIALADRRKQMRPTMANSPLCDLDGFAEDFLSAVWVVAGA